MSRLRKAVVLSIGLTSLFTLFQNCSGYGSVGANVASINGTNSNLSESSATAYPNMASYCSEYVVGWDSANGNEYGNTSPASCVAPDGNPLVFGVSHESPANGHTGAANYSATRAVYMNDYSQSDIGTWLNNGFYPVTTGNSFGLALDTLNYQSVESQTGWPIQYGHLFYGLVDTSVASKLNNSVYIEFDIRIRGDEIGSPISQNVIGAPAPPVAFASLFANGFSGHHITVGADAIWQEQNGRTNQDHFLEVTISDPNSYYTSYADPTSSDPHCTDAVYDRCFFDTAGTYAEGKYVSYSRYLKNPVLPLNTDNWTHVKIPFSDVLKGLNWVSPPTDWSRAHLSGLYIAIESMGATREWFEVKNYQVYSTTPK
jgi:hypothetical protein